MSTLWIAILLVALVSFAIKAAGPALVGGRRLPPRAAGVIALLAPALLAGLVLTDFAGPGWTKADWTVAAGLSVAGISYLLRAPMLVCVALAALATALLRLL
ncbi:AzlD domain-containing protein [Kibdelosporangium persicum]|uniref:Branched-subunit amino acid transport protein AzlD n=1 Tax=Kibdelosporangium persicum TaxID=2698649 RepID=A0ABX2F851_9PSEU|nr:AzlD domain-containing protein [Kibdelosporangium persicum]NRN66975.1 Branched-subunit amino acid transport protein AzlD [Kibdelosporangium persicum]